MNRKIRKRRKKVWSRTIIVGGIAIFALALIFSFITLRQREDSAPVQGSDIAVKSTITTNTVIVVIDGEPVDTREFLLFLKQERASVFAYFHQTYGANDSRTFWTSTYGNERPEDRLKQTALKDVVQTTVQQYLARKYGIRSDSSYASFLQALAQENARRQAAIASKQTIYGPLQYNEQSYFSYRFSNMVIQLKQIMGQKLFALSDNNLRAYYEQIKQNPNTRFSGQKSFEQIKESVREQYIDAQYTRLLTQMVQKATVTINQQVYAEIPVTG